jgi:hypothetical protein
MDQDIINEPINTVPTTGTQDTGINRKPVMPPDAGSTGNSDTPLPPDQNRASERDQNTGY